MTHSLNRRSMLMLAASGAVVAAHPALAQSAPWDRLEAARRPLGGTTPLTKGITLDLPLLSEDGASVPLTVAVESPMTADDHIQSIELFASRNPSPEIASFRFTPAAGRAQVQTRVRLNETQTVIAVARSSKGVAYAAARDVRITVTGCLVRAGGSDGAQEMQTRVRAAPARGKRGEPVEVLTLINHPMETGLREAPGGGFVPERIIRRFAAQLDGEPVFEAKLHRAVAANPYLRFFVTPQANATLGLAWTEDSGRVAKANVGLSVA